MMTNFNVVVEALIDAPPRAAHRALMDRNAGIVNWGMPRMESKLKEGSPNSENMVGVATFHAKGLKPRIVFKVTKIVEGKLIQIEYLDGGDFEGSEEYTFEPVDGKTRVMLRANFRPKGLLLTILGPVVKNTFIDLGQDQFRLLNDYVKQK